MMVVANPHGEVAYSGGYSSTRWDRPRTSRRIVRTLTRGSTVKALPLFGVRSLKSYRNGSTSRPGTQPHRRRLHDSPPDSLPGASSRDHEGGATAPGAHQPHRAGLLLFHFPVLITIAAFNHTGPILAAELCALTLSVRWWRTGRFVTRVRSRSSSESPRCSWEGCSFILVKGRCRSKCTSTSSSPWR